MANTDHNIAPSTNLKGFLERVVPQGVLVGVIKTAEEKIKQKVFYDHEHLSEYLIKHSWNKIDVWYALASFKEGWHPSKHDPSKFTLRTQDNVASLKAFWLDIDLGKGEGKSYNTVQDAVKAVKLFCAATQLPEPNIMVNSGGGLHAYWTLNTPVTPIQWQEVADALKAAALGHGLLFDPVCTADKARVLRPIQTFNVKYTPAAQVHAYYIMDYDYTLEHMSVPLKRYMTTLPVNAASPVAKDNSDLGGGIERFDQPKYTGFISERCEVMKHVTETRGADCEEPLWKTVLQLLVHTTDGEKWVHALSDGHPTYDFQRTEEKLHERKGANVGPPLCDTFRQFRPEKCEGCAFAGKIKTPLVLGADVAKWKSPQELPHNYRYANDGCVVEKREIVEDVDADGNATSREEWIIAAPFGIHMPHLGHDDENVHTCWFTCTTTGGETEVSFPTKDISDRRSFLTAVHSRGVMIKPQYEKHVVELLMTWITQLRDAKKTIHTVNKFGWNDLTGQPSFTLADQTIYGDGTVERGIHIDSQFGNIVKWYLPKGEFKDWKKCADEIVKAGPGLSTILASAFASPLLSMTELSGVMLSAVSTKSGVGKSTAMRTAQAVWGNPDGGVNSLDDTEASITKKLGLLNHLPAYWDELRGDTALENFGNTVFKLTGGKEKSRLRSDASARDVGTWQLMLVAASNQSLREFISSHAGMTDAGNLRLLEYNIERLNSSLGQAEAGELFRGLKSNYGHAGAEYSEYIVQNMSKVKDQITAMRGALEKHLNATHDERFWLAAISILVVGAQIATERNICDFDMRALTQHLLDVFQENRRCVAQATKRGQASTLLGDYLNDEARWRLVVDRRPHSSHDRKCVIKSGIADEMISYQVIEQEKVLLIPRSRFQNWCRRNRVQVVEVEKGLSEQYKVTKGTRILASGLMNVMSMRMWCLEIDISHPDFDDMFMPSSKPPKL